MCARACRCILAGLLALVDRGARLPLDTVGTATATAAGTAAGTTIATITATATAVVSTGTGHPLQQPRNLLPHQSHLGAHLRQRRARLFADPSHLLAHLSHLLSLRINLRRRLKRHGRRQPHAHRAVPDVAASRVPSGLHAHEYKQPECPTTSFATTRPALTSHTRTESSSPAEASCVPSGLHEQLLSRVSCPSSLNTSLHVVVAQTRTVPSHDDEARRNPSRLHAHEVTDSSSPASLATSRHVLESHTRTMLSTEAEASRLPSGLQSHALTMLQAPPSSMASSCPVWTSHTRTFLIDPEASRVPSGLHVQHTTSPCSCSLATSRPGLTLLQFSASCKHFSGVRWVVSVACNNTDGS